MLCAVSVLGCTGELAAAPSASVRLNIPARANAPGHPNEGWCGETAIQEALLHYGAFVPQRLINKAGKPTTPDLYARDIPVALRALGLRYRWWNNRGDVDTFIRWIQRQLRGGKPVLVGVKINPTEHPEWSLDHFVLVVGFDRTSLLLNTTWGRRERRSYADLKSTRKGFSFRNRFPRYYGLVIDGRQRPQHAQPVHLRPRGETRSHMTAEISASGLIVGRRYQLLRSRLDGKKPTLVETFIARRARVTTRVRIDKRKSAFFAVRAAH